MKQFSKLFFIFLFVFTISIGNTIAQKKNYAPVKKGERPLIDINKVDENAYEKGILKIKFKVEYSDYLDNTNITFNDKGNLIFGIAELDALNKKYKPQKFELVFGSPALKNEFTDRHRLWGFHLWYKLEFDENIDIKQLVTEYGELAEIEIAEPEYKVRLNDGTELENGFDFKWTPNDSRYDEQWHYHNTGQSGGTSDCDIDLPEAWNIEKGHEDVIVSIEDQGIQINHPDIADNMWSGIGYNFVQGNSNINPGDHGCHVAGTVAGVNNNSIGISGVAGGDGTTQGISLMSCQVFDPSGSGFDEAPVWAADNGACISQNSWSYTSAGYYAQSTLDAIDYFNANGGGSQLDGGITIFAAANNGTENSWYPACYSGSFAVAATTHTDQKAYYSNYGTWVDISAPGGETISVSSRGVLSCFTGSSYGWYQGTSMACPHTSGVAALIVSYAYRNGVILTNTDVADILRNTTDNHYGVNGSYTGKLGTGRLNAYQALVETQNYFIPTATVIATPDCGTGSVTVSSNITGIQTFYLKNNGGGIISEWTGDANSHEFTELSDGTYKGQVENNGSMSTLSEAVILTNYENTQITDQPEDVSATVGDEATFTVIADGENLTYQWKFEGADIDDADQATYQILSVSMDNAGNYSVAVNGNCGEEISQDALLTVLTSIEELNNFGINIYPNPSNGIINISYPEDINEMEVVITGITGKLVHKEMLNNNSTTITLQQEAGIYLIRFDFNNQSVISTIIIE